jgi:hypothetical protein
VILVWTEIQELKAILGLLALRVILVLQEPKEILELKETQVPTLL